MRTDERQPNSYRTPRAPRGVRRNRTAIGACLLLVAIVGVMGFAGRPEAQVRLPELGEAAEATFSPADERALGEAFMR